MMMLVSWMIVGVEAPYCDQVLVFSSHSESIKSDKVSLIELLIDFAAQEGGGSAAGAFFRIGESSKQQAVPWLLGSFARAGVTLERYRRLYPPLSHLS